MYNVSQLYKLSLTKKFGGFITFILKSITIFLSLDHVKIFRLNYFVNLELFTFFFLFKVSILYFFIYNLSLFLLNQFYVLFRKLIV